MKKKSTLIWLASLPLIGILAFTYVKRQQQEGYILEHEHDLRKEEPGSHHGGGSTTAFSYFSKDKSTQIAFRKRILHPGSSIGYHLQKAQEIYYILNGKGILTMNGKDIPVETGDGILTKPGSSHGLKPAGNDDLTVLIVYDIGTR